MVRAAGSPLSPEEARFFVRQRVARLATADADGRPQALPVCFAYDGASRVFIALDEKPKGVEARRLKRVRNILENPEVSLVADRYDDSDWSLLAFVMVRGKAELVEPGSEGHEASVRLLRGKYRQYERMRIEENPVVAIRAERASSWGALTEAPDAPLLEDSLFGRRSVRKYLDLEVPDSHIERVLEAARWAPSPHGRQPWRFAVIKKKKTKERLASAMGESWRENLEMDGQSPEVVEKRLEGSRRRLLDAPVLVLACLYLEDLDEYPDEKRRKDEETMAVHSLGAATQNMLLAAFGLGLDTSWMCAPLFTPRSAIETLDLDERLIPHALITLGYAEGDPPKRRSRRPLDELVVFRD